MRNAVRLLIAVPFCAAAFVVACGEGDSSAPGPKPDAAIPEASTDTSTPMDAGTDTSVADAAPDTGACAAYTGVMPNDAGAQCHDVVSNAPTVTVIVDPGTLPVGTGGTAGDGLYHLTEARLYPGSPVPAGTMLKYAVLAIGDLSYVVDDNNPAMTVRRTVKKNPDGGTGIILCETQVDNNPSASTSTSTCNEFTTFDSNSKFSAKFVKQ